MVNLLLHWFISTASLLIVAYIFPGIEVRGFGTALLAPIVIGLVNATIGFDSQDPYPAAHASHSGAFLVGD